MPVMSSNSRWYFCSVSARGFLDMVTTTVWPRHCFQSKPSAARPIEGRPSADAPITLVPVFNRVRLFISMSPLAPASWPIVVVANLADVTDLRYCFRTIEPCDLATRAVPVSMPD